MYKLCKLCVFYSLHINLQNWSSQLNILQLPTLNFYTFGATLYDIDPPSNLHCFVPWLCSFREYYQTLKRLQVYNYTYYKLAQNPFALLNIKQNINIFAIIWPFLC